MRRFFDTDDSWQLLVQRLVLGLVIFPHGAQKLLGWFGGHGFEGTMAGMSQGLGIPEPLVFLVIMAESFGALMLVLGVGTRLAAFGITAVMLGALFLVHLPNGFFMNWTGQQAGEGFEYQLLALALSIPILIKGAGLLSVDRWIARRRVERPVGSLVSAGG